MAKYKKQKDGRYRTSVFTGEYNEQGNPIKKYLSAQTIKELDEKVAETRHQINVNAFIFDRSTLFGEFAEQWLKTAKKARSGSTQAMYENILRLCEVIRYVPIADLTTTELQEKIMNANTDHPRTCQQIKMTLKQIFKLAIAQGLVRESPALGLELPRHVPKEKRALTAKEKKLLKEADLGQRDRALINTMYGTGMRSAEIYALTKDDIDYENGCIHVNKSIAFDKANNPYVVLPKTNSGIRSVIVSEALLSLLKTYSDGLPYDLLFGDDKGHLMKKHLYRSRFDSIMMRVFRTEHRFRDSGIDITPHTFRHTFCTECFYAGVSLKECQRQMGHSSTKLVLDVYSHCDSLKEQTAQKMAKITL